MLQDWIDSVCHEIRSPLQALIGTSTVLEEKILELELLATDEKLSKQQLVKVLSASVDELKSLVETITECGKQQATVLNNVLDLSKLETGNVQLHYTQFDPRDTVHSVYKMLCGNVQKNVQLRTNFA